MNRAEFSSLVRAAEFAVAGYLPGDVHPAYRNTPVLSGITGINVGMKGITNSKLQQINSWSSRPSYLPRKPNPYRMVGSTLGRVPRTNNPMWMKKLTKLAMTRVF